MLNRPFFQISQNHEVEIDAIRGSRFIANGFVVKSSSDANHAINAIKQIHPAANHHCWAFQLSDGITSRVNDDGEPNGSAGKPILAPLVGRHVFDSLIVVTRYFGGTKLGVGGLVRAYSKAANALLDDCTLIKVLPKLSMTAAFEYNDTQAIGRVLAEFGLTPSHETYTNEVQLTILIELDNIDAFQERIKNATAARVKFIKDESAQS